MQNRFFVVVNKSQIVTDFSFSDITDKRDIRFGKQVVHFQEETSKNLKTFKTIYTKWIATRKSSIRTLKELRNAIKRLKEKTKKFSFVSSGVGIAAGASGIIGGGLGLVPATYGLSPLASTLLKIGSFGNLVSRTTTVAASVLENKKIVDHNDSILKVLRKDEDDLQRMLKVRETIEKETDKFSLLVKNRVGYDFSLVSNTKNDGIDWLYEQVEKFMIQNEHIFPFLKDIDLKNIFDSLRDLRFSTGMLQHFGAAIGIFSLSRDWLATNKKPTSAHESSLAIIQNAIGLAVHISDVISLTQTREDGFESSRQCKDLDDIIDQLQRQAKEFEKHF